MCSKMQTRRKGKLHTVVFSEQPHKSHLSLSISERNKTLPHQNISIVNSTNLNLTHKDAQLQTTYTRGKKKIIVTGFKKHTQDISIMTLIPFMPVVSVSFQSKPAFCTSQINGDQDQ